MIIVIGKCETCGTEILKEKTCCEDDRIIYRCLCHLQEDKNEETNHI
jgi:hypothetical protein